MVESFISGAIAGYAIAIPVGAIAVLILETGLRRGFWQGLAAGSGAATADLIYAAVAATIGAVLAALLAPLALLLKWASALFLVALGAWGLWKLWQTWHNGAAARVEPPRAKLFKTYATLLGLTLLNPATVAYFAALILGLNVGERVTLGDKVAFVIGAFLASWSWQSLLAAIGALAHKHLSPDFRHVTSLVGNCVIIALGLKIVLG